MNTMPAYKQSPIFIELTIMMIVSIVLFCGCEKSYLDKNKNTDSISNLRASGLRALNLSDFEKAAEVGDTLITIAEKDPGNIEAAIYGRIILGQATIFLPDRGNECYATLAEAEHLCLDAKNDSALTSVYNGLGIYALNLGKNQASALEYFFKGLDIAKQLGMEDMHAILLTNIAIVYYLNNDPIGLRYSNECYEHGKNTGNDYCVYIGALTSANFHYINNEYELALRLIKEAELMLRRNNYEKEIPDLYCAYADILQLGGNDEEAEECYNIAINSNNRRSQSRGYAFTHYADFVSGKGEYIFARQLLDSALSVLSSTDSDIYKADVYRALSQNSRQLGRISEADEFEALYTREKNTIKTIETTSTIMDLRLRHDYDRAENALMRQRIDSLKKQRTINWLITICLVVLCITIATTWLYRRKSQLYSAIVKQTGEAVRNEKILRQTIRDLESRLNFATSDAGQSTVADDPHTTIEPDPSQTNDAISKYTPQLSAEKAQEIIGRLESLMLDVGVFTDNSISKDKVAKLIGTNRTYLSRIINEYYAMSFTQLINSLRIKEAIRRLSDPNDSTPLKALSLELGFNSMTTFYAQFSSETGMTPASYRAKAIQINSTRQEERSRD